MVSPIQAQEHPNLILTKQGVKDIRANLGKVPVFDKALAAIQQEVDAEIALGIDTPIPVDYSGGYTHSRHKKNFFMAQKAGMLYQILQDDKYATYVKDMFFQYEAMYLDLPVHPKPRSYARGKLFWQCLNDSNWLVYMAQAYDTIYDFLSAEERKTLEDNLFRPFADFISTTNPQFYNRIHNHSTWGNAAVGMIGVAMNDEELIQRALYGLDDDGIEFGTKDDDGGFLKVEGQSAGFLANLEEPFSPEGYFTEGPYYQRYAMYPFLVFAVAMENNRPDMKVLQHKDDVLMKAVTALLNLSDQDGEFFPLNDGQKGMSYLAKELVTAVDMAYFYGGKDPSLLSIAGKQNTVLLDQTGLAVALGIQDGKATEFKKTSANYGDGPNGDQGGVAVVRADNLELVFKYSAQGLSHGHYDKLSFSLFENGDEVLQDYGLSRFVNIEKKGGGNYLKENKTWAKQTIAHNTLTLDETSHFKGKYEIGSQHHSDLHFYESSSDDIQIVSAKEVNAYSDSVLHRTMAVIKDEDFEKPFLLDLFKVTSKAKHQYDLPYYFMGQVLDTSFAFNTPKSLDVLGKENGYQHLYVEGKSNDLTEESAQFNWLNAGKYYTLTTATNKSDEIMFTRLGANDPQFNLRRDAGIMLRRNDKSTLFASVIEPHGSYSPVTEASLNANSHIESLEVLQNSDDYTAVKITTVKDKTLIFILANKDAEKSSSHKLKIEGKTYKWKGPYNLIR
ncbi:alginate lyase family protein [Alteromonas sp. 5E99-2]|uniref:alginate lyase family protein n=1 Tax=Alteromonas sp. 5E99-2 TaxID=2817683 RepID=UPI001F6027A9|nr:alginate lyase family protein [Alteromonas sp. 5E99-2]